jgi:hypothetical protein
MDDVKRAADDHRLKTVTYVVEANNDERHLLWLVHSSSARSMGWGVGNVDWADRGGHGWLVQVGEIGGLPITLSVMFETICGKSVLFWTPESRAVDWEICREWVMANVPAYEYAHCNVANFGHCLAHLRR